MYQNFIISSSFIVLIFYRYDGYVLPPKASAKKKMKVVRELKQQLEKNPDLVPKSNWIFITLPLENSHRNHAIVKYDTVRNKQKYLKKTAESDSEGVIDNDEIITADINYPHNEAQAHSTTVSEEFAISPEEIHPGNSKMPESYIVSSEIPKSEQVLIHHANQTTFRNRTSNSPWIGYENEVDAAVASVVGQFTSDDQHVHAVEAITPVETLNAEQVIDQKVISVSLKELKQEHNPQVRTNQGDHQVIVNSSGLIESTPILKSNEFVKKEALQGRKQNIRQAKILATEQRLYSNLCTMNISATIDILKKLKEIVPNCADENMVESIAGIRKKLGDIYENYKYDKVQETIEVEQRIQDENYTRLNDSTTVTKKRRIINKHRSMDLMISPENIVIDDEKPVKKRKKTQLIEAEVVHTLMPAVVHHDQSHMAQGESNLICSCFIWSKEQSSIIKYA